MSSILRPFTFHIGASWAGKPADQTKVPKVPFPSDSPVGTWRDHTLSRPKAVRSDDAGEDFFYVQEVRTSSK
jgi:protein phosphatase PTC7